MSKLENFTDNELIEELSFRLQLRQIEEQCNNKYFEQTETNCEHMDNRKRSTKRRINKCHTVIVH